MTKISDGEKLILMMLCELYDKLGIKGGEVDPDFVRSTIYGGHLWSFDWKYNGLFHRHEDSEEAVREVGDVLDMWSFIEAAHAALSDADKQRLEAEAEPFGKSPSFRGFDGNNETEHLGIARHMIDQLDRFTEFKDRDLNSHSPSIDTYRRMLAVFSPMRADLHSGPLGVDQLVAILRERIHPGNR